MRALRLSALALVISLGLPGVVLPGGAAAQHDGHDHAAHDHAAHDHAAHAADTHAAPAHGDAAHGDAAHGDAAHGDDHHAAINWFELGGSFLNFGLLLLILLWLASKALPEFLRNRRAAVVEGMEEARRVKEQAEAKYKEYSERIENLDAELDRLREEMRQAGMDERDRIVAEAAGKAEKLRAEARFLIEQQMKQLREDLTREAIEAAVAAAEASLVKGISPQDQERLAKDYLGTIRTSLADKVQEKRL
jgi:F-type H+-transporting ATPase subunit b